MARKLNSAVARMDDAAQPAGPDASEAKGAEDLSVILPDVTLTIGGRAVTVREYRFIDGLEARAKGRPLIDDLAEMMRGQGTFDASDATIEDYVDMLAKHRDLVRELMAMSIEGADADWIDGLGAEGDVLLLTWWGTCGRFFVRVAMRRILAEVQRDLRKAAKKGSAGQTSSPKSPPPATVQPTSSAAATPSAN